MTGSSAVSGVMNSPKWRPTFTSEVMRRSLMEAPVSVCTGLPLMFVTTCGDAPVMLVNDRDMCSFMSNDKLDQLIDGLKKAEGQ